MRGELHRDPTQCDEVAALVACRLRGISGRDGVLGDRAARRRPGNQLPANALDLVFVPDAYHHFQQPRAMLAAIRDALKPGERRIVVDFERVPGVSSSWVLSHVRAGKATVIAEVEAAGFRYAE